MTRRRSGAVGKRQAGRHQPDPGKVVAIAGDQPVAQRLGDARHGMDMVMAVDMIRPAARRGLEGIELPVDRARNRSAIDPAGKGAHEKLARGRLTGGLGAAGRNMGEGEVEPDRERFGQVAQTFGGFGPSC